MSASRGDLTVSLPLPVATTIIESVQVVLRAAGGIPSRDAGCRCPRRPRTLTMRAPFQCEEGFAVVGDGTLDEPGRYALVCFVPVGADPDEFLAGPPEGEEGPPDAAGGPPHAVEGMHAELTIE